MGKASREKRTSNVSLAVGRQSDSQTILNKTGLLHKPIIHILLLIIIGFLAYSNTFNVPFHFDDHSNIVENYTLRDLSNFWTPTGSRWVGFLTFVLNYHFGGLNTIGYHVVNLIIHILNAILVYWLVMLTFRTPYFSTSNPPSPPFSKGGMGGFALFSALLFVSHPIQTQAVTYIVQRFTSLATFFYLLSLVMYIKFRRQQSAISGQQKLHATRYMLYAVSLISAVLAMKTKEISFTLPFIIILYEFCFFKSQNYELRTMNLRRLLYLLPFLLTLLIIPLSLIGTDKPIGDAIGELREVSQETKQISRDAYLLTQFRVIVTYIRLLVLPINQNLDYDYPIYHSFLNPSVFLSFLFLLSIFGLGVYLRVKGFKVQGFKGSNNQPSTFQPLTLKLISFGIFWFFITLSVESSIIPIRDVIFEHRVYMPSVGIFIAAVTSVFVFADSFKHKWPQAGKAIISVFVFIVIILSGVTCARNIIWQDEVSLWEDTVKKNPNKARGHNNLGNAYHNKGLTDMAIEEYQIALKLGIDKAKVYYNLGNAYYAKGWTDKAIEHYRIALKLNPDYSEPHNNLGAAYEKKELLDEAIKEYQTALRLNPKDEEVKSNLNRILRIQRSK